jgi:hypothetical protein
MESLSHDSGRTLVRAEYGYPKGSPKPTVKEEIRRYSSIQCSPQCTPKRPINEPHGATRQEQAIAKTPAK